MRIYLYVCLCEPQEAQEKAEEIKWKTDAETNATQLNLVRKARTALMGKYKKLDEDARMQKDIERSRLFNEYQMTSMIARDTKMKDLKEEVIQGVSGVSKGQNYKQFMKLLIVEGLLRMFEPIVRVRCRVEDEKLVASVLGECTAQYQQLIKEKTNVDVPLKLTLDASYLQNSSGGVWLIAKDSKLILRNTLESRVNLGFEALKPQVAEIIFGNRYRT
jgi:V-type H+-transporting ATPase subunit E